MPSLKVYYLDDEPDLLELFHDTFSCARIEVQTFQDPRALKSAIDVSRPDVIFLDFRLPHTNGDLIAQGLDPSIRKVLITGDASVKPITVFERVFEKPYSIRMIGDYLDSLADAKASP